MRLGIPHAAAAHAVQVIEGTVDEEHHFPPRHIAARRPRERCGPLTAGAAETIIMDPQRAIARRDLVRACRISTSLQNTLACRHAKNAPIIAHTHAPRTEGPGTSPTMPLLRAHFPPPTR